MRFIFSKCIVAFAMISLTAPVLAAVTANQETDELIKPFNPFELRDKSIRLENEALTEGIKSADGRWFDVEVIIFERVHNKDIREQFSRSVKNKKPVTYWDLQEQSLMPDLQRLLSKLSMCYSELDPLSDISLSKAEYEPMSASQFFDQFQQYKNIVRDKWVPTDNVCLMPSEKLSVFWDQYITVNYLPVDNGSLYTRVPKVDMPTEITAYDHDDFRNVYVLDEANLKLKEFAGQIEKKRSLNKLLHMAWRQPGLSPKNSIPVYIRAGKDFSDEFYYDGSQKHPQNSKEEINSARDNIQIPTNSPNSLDELTSEQMLDVKRRSEVDLFMKRLANGAAIDPTTQKLILPKRDNLPEKTWQLDGTINIKLDHYLYIETDLNYRKVETFVVDVEEVLSDNSNESDETTIENDSEVLISAAKKEELIGVDNSPTVELKYLKNFPLTQERRSYSGDIHYLDHPKFGIIFQIRKYRH